MPKNIKFRLQVKRRDDAIRRTRMPASLVTPGAAPRESWWTTAGRDGFTQQATQAPRKEKGQR